MSPSARPFDWSPTLKTTNPLQDLVESHQPPSRPVSPAGISPASPEDPFPSLTDGGSTPPEASPLPSSPPSPPPLPFLPPPPPLPSLPPPPPPPLPLPGRASAAPAPAPGDEEPRTRLWLKGLPADLDYPKLFRNFHKIGKVAAVSIHPGGGPAGPSSDVLLTFCRRADCRRFVRRHAAQPFGVDGRAARLTTATDRPRTATERAAETTNDDDADADAEDDDRDVYGGRTRVLFVSGAADLVSPAALGAFAAARGILVDTVHLGVARLPGGAAHADWQLGSIETQARRLFDALARLAAADPRLHDVRYGRDPCEKHR